MDTTRPILSVRELGVRFRTSHGSVAAVNGVSFDVQRGRTLGIVGESGSGKSQTMMAVMGLLARNGEASGQALLDGQDLLGMPQAALNRVRGARIGMIFQDPMTALNPYLTVERQLTEVLELHRGLTHKQARMRSIAALEAVRIPDAARRIRMHPHEFSGGMRQRIMVAMALLCEPDVLIADEPTTALDVTVQAQIVALLRDLQQRMGTAIVLITHDMGVVAGLCDEVVVLYGGRVMEQAPAEALFAAPTHPYTRGLLAAVPRLDAAIGAGMAAIPGLPPNLAQMPPGCPFEPRCVWALPACVRQPPLVPYAGDPAHRRACHRAPADVLASVPAQALPEVAHA